MKVGDKVRVRTDLKNGDTFRTCNFVSLMETYKGRETTISSVNDGGSFCLELSKVWHWDKFMLEPIEESK